MLRNILSKQQEAILADERHWLSELRVALVRFDLATEDEETLARSIRQLDELFLLVVVGEFNAGKSAFVNALLGQRLLEEGVTPTTTGIHLIKYGPEVNRSVTESATEVITAPLDLLREINIVDTPGTNAILRQHEAITRDFVPRSDMVLFVTSADRPFTESERAFLQRIREWGKKVVVIVNKIDILENADQVGQIEAFITQNARALLGFTPEVFPTSARDALKSKQTSTEKEAGRLLAASRFDSLERYIVDTLDEEERVRLKLLNPLGVGTFLAGKYLDEVGSRLEMLRDDLVTIQDIDEQLAIYKQDMERDFRFRLSDVENVLHEFENRGDAFFDETMRLARIFDLVNKAKLKADYEHQVISDAPQQIEERVNDVIDWLVASDLRQWQAVTDHLGRRRLEYADRIVGQVGGSFEYDRSRLLETVGRAAQQVIDGYDREHEAKRLAESVQMAVAGTALFEVGAIGLGALVSIIATTTLADVTGILAASAIAILGLFVIPARRRQAKHELRTRLAEVREELMDALTGQFDHELGRSLQRINEAIAPYTRFIRAERDRLSSTQSRLKEIEDSLRQLQARIESQ